MDVQRQLFSWECCASGSTVNREWMAQYTRHIHSTTILTAKHFKVKGQTRMEKRRSSPQEEASNIKRHLLQQKPSLNCCCIQAAKENILTYVGWILMWSVAKKKKWNTCFRCLNLTDSCISQNSPDSVVIIKNSTPPNIKSQMLFFFFNLPCWYPRS